MAAQFAVAMITVLTKRATAEVRGALPLAYN